MMFQGFYGLVDKNAEKVFSVLLATLRKLFTKVYANDNLIAINRVSGFLEDERFMGAFNRQAKHEQEKTLAWRIHTLIWAANQTLEVPGDFVECGVFRGFCSAVMTDYLNFEQVDKTLYLYDTFTGIPEELNSEKHSNRGYIKALNGDRDSVYQHVKSRFASYNNVKVIRGILPTSFEQACPEKIAFLHLDLNSSMAEIKSLEVLFDRISPGGIIVFDDYGQMPHKAQHLAENDYLAKRGYQLLELPTGQGLLVKKC